MTGNALCGHADRRKKRQCVCGKWRCFMFAGSRTGAMDYGLYYPTSHTYAVVQQTCFCNKIAPCRALQWAARRSMSPRTRRWGR